MVVLLLGPFSARAEWTPPVLLSATGGNARVAVDGRGDAFAVWQECRSGCKEDAVMADYLSAGASLWQAPVEVSTGEDAQIAADSLGDGIAAWNTYTGLHSSVRLAPVGTWQSPTSLTSSSEESYETKIAADPSGEAVAVWQSPTFGIYAALRPAATGQWEAPTAISAKSEHASEPSVAIREGGEVAIAWQVDEPETAPCPQPPSSAPCSLIVKSRESIKAAIRPVRGVWQTPDTLIQAPVVTEPTIVLDSAGNATAMWVVSNGEDRAIESSRHPAGGSWQERVTVSAGQLPYVANSLDSSVRLGVDAQGEVTATWVHAETNAKLEQSGVYAVQTAVRRGNGSWSASSTISGYERLPGALQLAENPSGAAVAVWSCSVIAGHYPLTARGAYRAGSGARWQPVVDISPIEGGYPEVAIGPEGRSVAIWESGRFTTPAPPPGLYASVYDPSITSPGVPQSHGCAARSAVVPVPVISGLRMTHRRFRSAQAPTAIDAKVPSGTAFLFRLNTPARLEIALSRYKPGRRRGRLCVPQSRALERAHSRRCRRFASIGKLSRHFERAGEDRVPFSGRIGRRAFGPGDYVAHVTAVDSAGSSSPAVVRFTIVR